MKYHPYSEIWPLMSGKDFEELKADIEANGLRVDIITYQNMVLDGRNRHLACTATGTAARYVEANVKNDDEALDLVVSLNTHRRHLSVTQRAFAAAKLANVKNGSNRYAEKKVAFSNEKATSETTTMRTAAAKIGVSYGSAVRAKTVLAKGTTADVQEVLDGKVSLGQKTESLIKRTPRVPKATPQKQSEPHRPTSGPNRVLRLHNTAPLKVLTREEVDPEFKGTPMEFVDKYGHVQTMTAERYATEQFTGWVSNVRALAKRWKELPEIGRPVDHNWLRNPRAYDVAKLTESLDYLRPKIAEAEALLARATAALSKKPVHQEPHQSACG